MDYQQLMPLTLPLSKPGFVAGTTSTFTTGGAINFMIRGKIFQAATQTNVASPTTDFGTTNNLAFLPVPANFGSIYLFGFDHNPTPRAIQGGVLALSPVNNLFLQAPQFGGIPLDFCPFGYLVIKAGPTASASPGWRLGIDNMSGVTGITYTFVDAGSMPDRPQVA
jgi:hypothetical protein